MCVTVYRVWSRLCLDRCAPVVNRVLMAQRRVRELAARVAVVRRLVEEPRVSESTFESCHCGAMRSCAANSQMEPRSKPDPSVRSCCSERTRGEAVAQVRANERFEAVLGRLVVRCSNVWTVSI